jgi:GxxExxY protein
MDKVPARIDAGLNALSRVAVDAIFAVHKAIGPGLLESVYEACLLEEFRYRGCLVQCQVPIPIIYRTRRLDSGLRLDILLDNRLLIELKSVETILPVHKAQVISYLKLANLPLGLLVNFNVAMIKEGIQRIAN